MFPQNFTFKNFELQTTEIEKTFLLLLNGSKGFKRIKKRDNSKKNEFVPSSDLDRIQTCNLLSRNQVRYSVAPRGLLKWVQI